MKRTSDVLERTFYLARIKSLEIRAYMIQIAAMMGIGFFFSLVQGATFKPFYLPIEYFTYVVLIMLVGIVLESFFFTILEIRNQDSDSARYFTAKKASKNTIKIIIISIIIIGVFTNPAAEGAWENLLEEEHTVQMVNSTALFTFSSLDRLGIMENSLEIRAVSYSGNNYTVYVFDKGVYHPGINYRANARFFTTANPGERVSVYPPDSTRYNEYTVLITGNGTGEFSYKVQKEIIPNYTLYSALFLTAITISEAWWFVYLQKLIKKYGTELVSE